MPRGRGKGGNKRKRGKNMGIGERRELLYKEEGQEYGQILRMLGQGRLEVNCFDGVKRLCSIRGKLRNRVWMGMGDIILVSLRDEGENKGDVIHKYYPEESLELQEAGEIPENINVSMITDEPDEEDGGVVEDSDEDEDGNKKQDDVDIDDI